jgi:hypothetical protein
MKKLVTTATVTKDDKGILVSIPYAEAYCLDAGEYSLEFTMLDIDKASVVSIRKYMALLNQLYTLSKSSGQSNVSSLSDFHLVLSVQLESPLILLGGLYYESKEVVNNFLHGFTWY